MDSLFPLEGNPILPHHPVETIMGAVLLLCIWVLFAKVVAPRLERNYQDRADQIQGGIERAQRAQAEADSAKQKYEQLLSDARAEASRIREDAKNQASQIVAEARKRASLEADGLIAEAHAQIHAERDYVMTSLKHEVGEIAIDLAERIVAESLTDDDRAQRTVDRFLDDLALLPEKSLDLGADQL